MIASDWYSLLLQGHESRFLRMKFAAMNNNIAHLPILINHGMAMIIYNTAP